MRRQCLAQSRFQSASESNILLCHELIVINAHWHTLTVIYDVYVRSPHTNCTDETFFRTVGHVIPVLQMTYCTLALCTWTCKHYARVQTRNGNNRACEIRVRRASDNAEGSRSGHLLHGY